ncbi:MAG: hypothetical protein COY98_00965 [Candidatus Yonathbacteria bacterium CG_4_10_14_0_8_um_filter_43_17]|uniref:Uncharacterized protein n=1 Tax=Candidatus Yonathbacteria bacterium CG_4_10_14_0_8_um_filter_43_17 TaxID=1975099 RepID=A0A2M7Q5H4_9BACT|nr:MAG: hypothetical protein COY98_00965 [Candidatus Yonathbacteria bacterium CG_4_10_14_0_8_um_filter_43_17]
MNNTSQKQIDANRENGKKGGVKTEDGKAVSKYNALKHGILSKQILFEGEDENELLELEKRLRSELSPASELELLMVDKIASNIWRLKRALSFEKDDVIFTSDFDGTVGLKSDADRFFRYETMLERSIYKALHELERMQARRNGEKVPPPIALDVDISNTKEDGFVS